MSIALLPANRTAREGAAPRSRPRPCNIEKLLSRLVNEEMALPVLPTSGDVAPGVYALADRRVSHGCRVVDTGSIPSYDILCIPGLLDLDNAALALRLRGPGR